ncbi:unnamed protein product [Prunus brigantina]
MGVQINIWRPKILQNTGQNSYPRYKTSFGDTFVLGPTPKSRWKWPELEVENWQIFNRLFTLQNSEISPIQHIQPLEHLERLRKHTWIVKFGLRKHPNELPKNLTKTVQKQPKFLQFPAITGGSSG